jgi:hypothetical protein
MTFRFIFIPPDSGISSPDVRASPDNQASSHENKSLGWRDAHVRGSTRQLPSVCDKTARRVVKRRESGAK